jgi:uncharacterized protein YeaO (DUF488 family)
MSRIALARVYHREQDSRGRRFLVERLWPRGVRREALRLDSWLPEVGPSHELRKWFAHDPDRWEEFQRRYFVELDGHPEVWRLLIEAASAGDITLLYSSRDTEHNNAVALRRYLVARLGTAVLPDQEAEDSAGSRRRTCARHKDGSTKG